MEDGIWQKRSKFLAHALIFSMAINFAFLATFTYFILKNRGDSALASAPEAKEEERIQSHRNPEILQSFCEKNFQELVELLADKELLEDGYQKRDFALGVLVSFHQFDLGRALGGRTIEHRQILFSIHPQGETVDLTIFSGLADDQYEAIIRFAKTEKWPLTSQGLFFEIKRNFEAKKELQAKLAEAFLLSPEYLACATLFHRCGYDIPQMELLYFLAEGDWHSIKKVYEAEHRGQLLSLDHLRLFLVDYLQCRSKRAAKILLAIDIEFAFKRLADEHVLFILDHVDLKEKNADLFAKAILCSARNERVVRVAAQKLYASAGQPMPQNFQIIDAIRHFCPQAVTGAVAEAATRTMPSSPPPESKKKKSELSTKKTKQRTYVVKEGDSLWKIAKKLRVSSDKIREANALQSDKLKVGQELKIPSN